MTNATSVPFVPDAEGDELGGPKRREADLDDHDAVGTPRIGGGTLGSIAWL
jgi:hypothetical protein